MERIVRIMFGRYYVEGTNVTLKSFRNLWRVYDGDKVIAETHNRLEAKEIALKYVDGKGE